MKLVFASKCYSSWSLRPWLAMRVAGIAFDEIVIGLRQADTAANIAVHSPTGVVPVLKDGDLTVWDSLAIIEYLAERFPDAGLWPADVKARAMARSISAEMHSGFQPLRGGCPMNLAFRFAARDRGPAVDANVARIEALWRTARQQFGAGGPFLFGAFSAADAMYAPVVMRFDGYSIPVAADTRAYMDAVLALPAFEEWRSAGLLEPAIPFYDDVAETRVASFRTT